MTFNFVLDADSQTRPQTTDHRPQTRRTILITGKKVDLTIDLTTTTTTTTHQLALPREKQVDRTLNVKVLDILKV